MVSFDQIPDVHENQECVPLLSGTFTRTQINLVCHCVIWALLLLLIHSVHYLLQVTRRRDVNIFPLAGLASLNFLFFSFFFFQKLYLRYSSEHTFMTRISYMHASFLC